MVDSLDYLQKELFVRFLANLKEFYYYYYLNFFKNGNPLAKKLIFKEPFK